MGAIAAAQVVESHVYGTPGGERVVTMLLNTVTDADTIDVSTIGPVTFKTVKCASAVPCGALAAIGVVTPTGTSCAIVMTGAARHSIWLIVVGDGPDA